MESSPDQVAADCVFCRIVAREGPAAEVYRDEQVTAFLDHHPVTPGHLLVVTNAHIASFGDISDELGAHLFHVGHRLSAALRSSDLPCEGVNLFLADGEAAFQEVFHVHLHVIPRTAGDGFTIDSPAWRQPRPAADELEANAREIRMALIQIGIGPSPSTREDGR
jgi:diadenosine tetraphosphate (Ap4A) HIT family hydrolase